MNSQWAELNSGARKVNSLARMCGEEGRGETGEERAERKGEVSLDDTVGKSARKLRTEEGTEGTGEYRTPPPEGMGLTSSKTGRTPEEPLPSSWSKEEEIS